MSTKSLAIHNKDMKKAYFHLNHLKNTKLLKKSQKRDLSVVFVT